MNPMTNVKNIQKLNEQVLKQGIEDNHSWHGQYKDSAYIFIGGLPYDLTEGDILCVFSQYGEIVNVNMARDKKTGKSKGFCFICYEDQRSTILAVDNFNGIKLGGRTIRVDHCANYRRPLGDEKDEDGKRKEIIEEGCAPKTPSPSPPSSDNEEPVPRKKHKKEKKAKKHKKTKERKEEKIKSGSREKFEGKPQKKDNEFEKNSGGRYSNVRDTSSERWRDNRLGDIEHKLTGKPHLARDQYHDKQSYDRDGHRQHGDRIRAGYRDGGSSRRKDEDLHTSGPYRNREQRREGLERDYSDRERRRHKN